MLEAELILDHQLIHRQRVALKMSQRELAKRLGLSVAVVRKLEEGTNHGEQTLKTTMRLAEALQMPTTRLLLTVSPPDPDPDDVRIEAALATVGRRLSGADLAHALNMSLRQVHDAVRALRARLAPTGQQVHQRGGKYLLTPAHEKLTSHEIQELERRRVTTNGLRQQEAEMLLAAIRGQATASWFASRNGSLHANGTRLVRLGYAELVNGALHVTPAVERSLGLRR